MIFCHFATLPFYTLCNVEPGEDTINIRTANIKGTFFYSKTIFFQSRRKKGCFTFCQRRKKNLKQVATHSPTLIVIKISCHNYKTSIYFNNFVTMVQTALKRSFKTNIKRCPEQL